MIVLKLTPTVLLFALSYATKNNIKYNDPNTWNMSLPEDILQYLDILDAIDPTTIFRNTSVLDDHQCNEDYLSIFHDLRENYQWPKVMLDAGNSFQHGILEGNRLAMGNYDECLSVNPPNRNFTGKYCLAYVNDSIDPLSLADYGLFWFRRPMVSLGLCVPSTCSVQYLNRVLNEVWIPNSNQTISDNFGVGIDDEDCHTSNESPEFTTLNWIAIAVMGTIAACMTLSSFYDIWCMVVTKNEKPSTLYLAFSVPHNLTRIFNTRGSNKDSTMSGIKAMIAIYIVFCHCYYLELNGNIQNWRYGMLAVNGSEWGANIINHGTTVVDTFFVLSGILIVITFLRDVKQRSQYDPAQIFLKRYLRLMTPAAFLILVKMGLSDLFYTGPVSKAMNRFYGKGCKGYVWSNLLLYNNFIQDTTQMCIQHVWYIYVDLQLCFASQFLLIYGLWNPKKCAQLSGILCWGFAVLEFIIACIYDMGITPSFDRGNLFKLDYSKPHGRATPWLAGMCLGFCLQYIISLGVKPTKVQKIIAWLLCGFFLFVTIYPLQFFTLFDYEQPWAALYLSFKRVTWAIFLSIVIILCETSCGGYIGQILSWAPLRFFDNIALELYLVHVPCLEFYIATGKATFYISLERGWYLFFGILSFSCIMAITLSVMVTIPSTVIIQHFLGKLKIMPIKSHWKTESRDQKDVLA